MDVLDVPGTTRLNLGLTVSLERPWVNVIGSGLTPDDARNATMIVVDVDPGVLPWPRASKSLEVLDLGWLTVGIAPDYLLPVATEVDRLLTARGRARLLIDTSGLDRADVSGAFATVGLRTHFPDPEFGEHSSGFASTTWHPPLAAVDVDRHP